MGEPVGLRIVGQDRLFVEAVVGWLAARPDFRVIDPAVSAVADASDAFDAGASVTPEPAEPPASPAWGVDVVLIDSSHRDGALAAAWRAGEELPGAKLLILGIEQEDEGVLDFVEAGAHGYLLKGASAADLAAAIHDVHAGRTRCSPRIAAAVLARIGRLGELGRADRADRAGRQPATSPQEALTGRELDILRLLAAGLSNKEIALDLSISLSTVKNHVHNLLVKLAVRRRREAIRFAYEQGLLPDLLADREGG
jgi:DNA-binding NarL/FixJ family response regulator